ncbi:unnamed protein product [Caenorhabditis bovis]|uniref:Methyltransferase domain-containing protein n=1 Tax=Caenorhabditis bovis TaxID=2654633 RepID=A0A8S1EFS7_9PELO|nr:unnamed protein product [Caenorhabditis bovis]
MSYQLQRTYGIDSTYWYTPENAMPPMVGQLFMKSDPDEVTQAFLDQSASISGNYFWQTIRNVSVMVLGLIYTKTDINGFTGFGNMFLFSENQMAKFLGIDRQTWSSNGKKILDLGAGNGDITAHLKPLFDTVYATELSKSMRRRLTSKGYKLLNAVDWATTDEKFDLITAFNLLDRHYSPRKLLRDLWKKSHESNCYVVLSLVLPISHYVEFNPIGTGTWPDAFLNVRGRTYTEHLETLIVNEIIPANFEVIRWTRLPYLCEGDMHNSAYYLSDAVFLLKPLPSKETITPPSDGMNREQYANTHQEL